MLELLDLSPPKPYFSRRRGSRSRDRRRQSPPPADWRGPAEGWRPPQEWAGHCGGIGRTSDQGGD
jgi:hypothetical protein